MKQFRFLSVLMAFCMVIGAFSQLSVFASDEDDAETTVSTEETTVSSETSPEDTSDDDSTIDYVTKVFRSEEEKLASMTLKLKRFDFELYYEPYTGEVAVKNTITGNVMFTNPYDVASSQASDNIKTQLLSQIVVQYTSNDSEISMYSYVEAAQRSQIVVKNIKNGVRVEYAMGRQETRKLAPNWITQERYETMILSKIQAAADAGDSEAKSRLRKMDAFYLLKDPNAEGETPETIQSMYDSFPITKQYPIYVLAPDATEREKNIIEAIIKKWCPEYSYEELEYDHALTEYTSEASNPANFKLALEYYLDEDGLSVRFPANGLRFDESTYSLTSIRILPYMGAGSSEYTGYTMIPDGSGALVRFEDIVADGASQIISGKLYGQDYAYHEIKGANQEVMRLPVFGLVEDRTYQVDADGNIVVPGAETTAPVTDPVPVETDENGDTIAPAETEEPVETDASEETAESVETDEPAEETDADGNPVESAPESETTPVTSVEDTYTTVTSSRGFVAIIEEGDALANIFTDHGGNILHKYNSVFTEFYPRPKDSYNLATAISIGANATWTVVSERKYTGSYRIRYIMLTGEEQIEEIHKKQSEEGTELSELYEASYVGMAKAYRAMLVQNGTISALKQEADSIPMYMETIGVMDVSEKILSVPVTVKRALTTFEDIKTMYTELSAAGITNLNFKLNGFANGGLYGTTPYKVKFEKTAGGDDGYTDLVSYANEKNFGVYPEFDFSYVNQDKWFDGFSLKRDAIKTIDNRYTQKRTYSAMLQYFTSTGLVAISPSVFSNMFGSMKTYMDKLTVSGISVSTLGSDLSSDFDKNDPYNREDSKEFVMDTLSQIKAAYGNVMVDGGNAYTLAYVTDVLNVSLDSSNYTYASDSIPFFGLVFHGYLNFAGTPTNMVGDVDREVLKLIENGAAPYFMIAMSNTEELKESTDLNRYYSIKYSIWKDDLIKIYNELNTALSDVMYAPISNHEFLIGERIPTAAEIEKDEAQAEADKEAAEKEAAERLSEAERLVNLYTRKLSEAQKAYDDAVALAAAENTEEALAAADLAKATLDATQESYDKAVKDLDAIKNPVTPDEEETEDPETPEYNYTKYTSDNGMIIRVTYENGISFILNYNNFDIITNGYTVKAYDAVKINAAGDVVLNSIAELRKGTN